MAQRWFAMMVLACWMTPSLGALALAVHLVVDHLEDPGAGHGPGWSQLSGAFVHGHDHGETVPDHEHEAVLEGLSFFTKPEPFYIEGAPFQTSFLPSEMRLQEPLGSQRYGPPPSLFTSYCSLLL